MYSSKKSFMKGISGALGALFLTANAVAATVVSETVIVASSGARQAAVSYADLNLDHPNGRAVLAARVKSAAEAVCGDDDYRRAGSMSSALRNWRCQERAVDSALDQVPVSMVVSRR